MERGTRTMLIIIFVLIVVGMFAFAMLQRSRITQEEVTTPEVETPAVAYPAIDRIDGKHYFIDGVHTVVGELALPTPCDLLEAEAQVEPGAPETITINFNVINNADACAQVVSVQRYMVSATGTKDAIIKANFMDREVPLNLIPAAAGETPEEFELFTKG